MKEKYKVYVTETLKRECEIEVSKKGDGSRIC